METKLSVPHRVFAVALLAGSAWGLVGMGIATIVHWH
jgi:hypothetical protein